MYVLSTKVAVIEENFRVRDRYQAERSKSKLENSPEHNWAETTYDGKEGSDVIAVPNHWHRVRSLYSPASIKDNTFIDLTH